MTEQHADLYRLVKWQPMPMLERDLPPGVEYTYAGCPNERYLKCNDNQCVILMSNGRRTATVAGARMDLPVTILDWPDWCGPRPTSTPTWADIIVGAPAGSVAWFEDRDGLPHLCKIPAIPRPTPPHNRFVGWLVPA